VIEIKNLKKSFNGKTVLRKIDLDIPKSRTEIIIGRSGSGKSVLLKHIIGLIRPEAGEIFVDGEEISRLSVRDLYRVRRKFGMLFQSAALFDSMTVEENIALSVREHRMFAEPEIRRRVDEKLEMVGLPGIHKMRPAELSGGMKKRVGLARALMMDPEFVLYDEPTTGLDPIMADAINDLIIYCTDHLKVTSIVVTHDMVSAYKVGDRISMLHEGEIIFSGTPKEVQSSDDPVVRQFIEGKAEGPLQVY
jgi:phospholipid/cholesterol/gamma-HCH transport system ATP-binding protein